jgi:hypothetical protein
VDGAKVEFPYAYATLDRQFEAVQFSLFDGDIASCSAARLPGGGHDYRRRHPFEDIGASDPQWRPPDSTLVDILKLSAPSAQPRLGALDWRGVGNVDTDLLSERPLLSTQELLASETLEVCIPQEKTIQTSPWGDDEKHVSELTIRGLIRAKMCGEETTPKAWHSGELECDAVEAQEGGQPIELEFFRRPKPARSLVGFRKSDGIGCDDVEYQRRPLVEARVLGDEDALPVGYTTSFTTDRGVRLANRTQGNFISPVGPEEGGAICLHHPVYWYQDGKIGVVRGLLTPTVCPPTDGDSDGPD